MSQSDHTITITRGAATVNITDLASVGLVEFDGFGMPPIRRITQRGPMQNGDTDVGYRLDPRVMRIAVLMAGIGDQAALDDRAALMGILRPSTTPIRVRWQYGDMDRQIDVQYSGGMSLPSSDWRYTHHRAVFELRAADPTWYDTSIQQAVFARDGGGSGFVFPLMPSSANITFGGSSINSAFTISMSAPNVWDTYPLIIITGPITNCIITNQTTGDKLSFSGYTISTGQTVTIDCNYGVKTIYNGVTNWIQYLSSDSALATFRLVEGDNSILVTGSAADGNTYVEMDYRVRYIGV